MTILGALLVAYILLGAYLAPTLIAATRHHHQLKAVAALNILLGWTLLGWCAAMVLAFWERT